MSSISKPDHCAERPSLALLSAYQEYLMTFKLMTSQVVQRTRLLITHICAVGIQRVNSNVPTSMPDSFTQETPSGVTSFIVSSFAGEKPLDH